MPLTNEDDVVLQIEGFWQSWPMIQILLEQLRQQGMHYARECLSWDGKAQADDPNFDLGGRARSRSPIFEPRRDALPPRRTDGRMADLLVANLLFYFCSVIGYAWNCWYNQ